MKKTTIVLFAILFMGLALEASARKIDKNVKAVLVPSSIVLFEDQGKVDVNFKISIPKKFVHRSERFIFTPLLTDFDKAEPLTSIIIEGKKFFKIRDKKNAYKDEVVYDDAVMLANAKEPRMLDYTYTINYEPWMKNANLLCFQKFITRREVVVIAEDVYAKGITTSKPVVVQKPVIQKSVCVINKMTGKININFLINSAKLDMNLANNMTEMVNLQSLIGTVMNNNNITIDSIVLKASCSPDGIMEQNKTLARERANAIKSYLAKELSMPQSSIDKIKTSYVNENWKGLEMLVNASDIKNKAEVMKALKTPDNVQREKAMRTLPQFNYIRQYLLPQLRYATYEIYYSSKDNL
ncbi:MAG: hypothetical protein RR363_01765 [Rikenellaceae bacterium]